MEADADPHPDWQMAALFLVGLELELELGGGRRDDSDEGHGIIPLGQ